MSLTDRVYIVTGGASGIGAATVAALVERGAKVVVADFNEEMGRVVVERHGASSVAFIKTDVSSETDTVAMVEFAVSTFGRLDGAVNNAGIGQPVVKTHELDLEDFDRIVAVDLRGAFLCMRAEIRYFLESGVEGSIVNTASVAATKPVAGQGAYGAAKRGVVGLTEQAALEYVREGIRVNAVSPGGVRTEQFLANTPEVQAMYESAVPVGRLAEPSEIARTIAFLLSDDASYVSGSTLLVDAATTKR